MPRHDYDPDLVEALSVDTHYDFVGLPGQRIKKTIKVVGITIEGDVLFFVQGSGSKPVTKSIPIMNVLFMGELGILVKREK